MNKQFLNKLKLITLILMVAWLLAACSDNKATPTTSATTTNSGQTATTTNATAQIFAQASTNQTPTAAAQSTPASTPIAVINPNLKTSLTFWSDMSGAQSQLLADQVKQFMQAYPGVKINVADYNPDEIVTDFPEAVANGDGPDLIFTLSDSVSGLVAAKAIQPVDSLINSQKYAQNAVTPSHYQGKQYGVPFIYGNTIVMLYNKNLVSTPPADTNQWIAMAQEIAQPKGKPITGNIGLIMDVNEPANLVPWVYAYSGSLLNTQSQPNLNSQPMQQALTFFQQLIKQRLAEISYNPAQNQADYAFRDGRLGFYVTTDSNALNYLSSNTKNSTNTKPGDGVGLSLGIAPLPKLAATGKNPSPFTDSEAMFVSTKTSGSKLEAIKDFFGFVATPEEQSYMAMRYHLLPSTGAGLSSDIVKNDDFLRGLAAQLALDTPMPNQPEMAAVWDAIRPNLEQAMANTIRVQDATAAMQQTALSEIQAQGLSQP